MSNGRLTFLYPHLFRSIRLSEQATQVVRHSSRRQPPPSASPFSSSRVFRVSAQATKPPEAANIPHTATAAPKKASTANPKAKEAKPTTPDPASGDGDATRQSSVTKDAPEEVPIKSTPEQDLPKAQAAPVEATPTATSKQPKPEDVIPLGPPRTEPPSPSDAAESPKGTAGPMDAILRMPPPSESEQAKTKTSHLAPPPYVHHFDTYSLVKQLSAGGYTQAQSITAMKAVRQLLASNLDVAQSELVSKSDVENETYLFRAACSELSTEVQNNRRVADEQMRQQRTLLQHEVDILSQSLSGELLALNDSVRGMFNDRRMAVREEQKAVESAIQQINYKISITLTSDAKSEIEGLRWVLIRRSVLGIIFMAVLMFGSLRYGSYLTHEKQKEAERLAREKKAARKKVLDGKHDRTDAPEAALILTSN